MRSRALRSVPAFRMLNQRWIVEAMLEEGR